MPANELCSRMQAILQGSGMAVPTAPVAVIIVGRNYGNYLPDCIESVRRQNPLPGEILYVDNASTDGSAQIAQAENVAVHVISTREHNICACRNRGAALTTQPYLVFVDADDTLPPGYISQLLPAMARVRCGIAFPRFTSYGTNEHLAPMETNNAIFKGGGIYRENYIVSAALVKRQAFNAVGGWDGLPIFQDWDLWLRILDQGWLASLVPEVIFPVRTHGTSKSANFGSRQYWYQDILRHRGLTVFTPFGPGGPIHGKRYFKALERMGLKWGNTVLFFYDNSNCQDTADRLQNYLRESPALGKIYYRDPTQIVFTNLHERARVVPERMSEIWYRASRMFDTPFVLSLEHDIEPEEAGAASRLYEGMAPDVDAVTGLYRLPITRAGNDIGGIRPRRTGPESIKEGLSGSQYLIREWIHTPEGSLSLRPIQTYPSGWNTPPSDGCITVGATGMGCVLIRRDAIAGFDFEAGQRGQPWIGQDFGFWRHVRDRGMRLMAHYGVECRHWYTAENYV